MNCFRRASILVLLALAVLVLPASAQPGRPGQVSRAASAIGNLAGRLGGALAAPQGLFGRAPAAAAKTGSAATPSALGTDPAAPGGQVAGSSAALTFPQPDSRGTLQPDGQH
jgi:hypothetical protein